MILLIIKVFFFNFKNVDRRNIMTEEDKVIEEQNIKDYESKLDKKLNSDTEKAQPDIDF